MKSKNYIGGGLIGVVSLLGGCTAFDYWETQKFYDEIKDKRDERGFRVLVSEVIDPAPMFYYDSRGKLKELEFGGEEMVSR